MLPTPLISYYTMPPPNSSAAANISAAAKWSDASTEQAAAPPTEGPQSAKYPATAPAGAKAAPKKLLVAYYDANMAIW